MITMRIWKRASILLALSILALCQGALAWTNTGEGNYVSDEDCIGIGEPSLDLGSQSSIVVWAKDVPK
jgi:hypothetical protein